MSPSPSSHLTPSPPTAILVVSWEQHLLVLERLDRLEAEVAQMKRLQSEWVSQKEALQITGIKSADTLKRERERPGTLIVVRKEGKTSKQPNPFAQLARCLLRVPYQNAGWARP